MNTFNAPTTQINAIDKMTTVKSKTVDLEGYVIIVVQTKDNKVKLYGKCFYIYIKFLIMYFNETRCNLSHSWLAPDKIIIAVLKTSTSRNLRIQIKNNLSTTGKKKYILESCFFYYTWNMTLFRLNFVILNFIFFIYRTGWLPVPFM